VYRVRDPLTTANQEVKQLRKIALAVLMAVAMTMLLTGTAFANFAIHGSYVSDTDACAGCHRAHTAFSQVGRTNYFDGSQTNDGSALLVGSSQNMKEFCYTCHGNGAPGASTNVEAGVFDAGPSASTTNAVNPATGVLYSTESSFGAVLNGGGFELLPGVTSMHNMDAGSVTDPMWGQGSSAPAGQNLTCTGCHDPHGSSNYRLLKDTVGNNVAVGGYLSDSQPTPFVVSAETGYPDNGFVKHVGTGAYKPDYTTPLYRATTQSEQGMSGWCAGCHEQYNDVASAYNYGQAEADRSVFATFSASPSGARVGSRMRHRHPVNVALDAAGAGPGRTLATDVVLDSQLPLELAAGDNSRGHVAAAAAKSLADNIGCLTCHRAHGTAATMSGWAEARLVNAPSNVVTWTVEVAPGTGGVNPNSSSALLRTNNRGVCERCHNK
jgi:predicted CXXCH cytochrome family protein